MRFIALIQSIVWPAVVAVAAAVASVAVAFLLPGALAEALALAGTSITFALLALRG